MANDRYVSTAWMEQERERLWSRAWLLAARAAELAEGGWLVREVGADSYLLTRAVDGRVRAFHNVCAHRGTLLCEGRGTGPLTCPYHGWRYGLDGRLEHALRAGEAATRGLSEVRCAEAHGFVWLAEQPDEELDAWLAPIADRLEGAALGSWSTSSAVHMELACNWKLSSDVHLEAYHVPTLHSEIGPMVAWDEARFEPRGRHGRLLVSPKVEGIGENELIHLFPNAQINLHPEEALVFVHLPHPTDPQRCRFEQTALRRSPGPPARPREATKDDSAIGPVTAADLKMAERLQRGVRSRGFQGNRYAPLEGLVAHANAGIDAFVGEVP